MNMSGKNFQFQIMMAIILPAQAHRRIIFGTTLIFFGNVSGASLYFYGDTLPVVYGFFLGGNGIEVLMEKLKFALLNIFSSHRALDSLTDRVAFAD